MSDHIQTRLFADQFLFSDRFMEDHAGRIITDPKIAVVELVANAYDAGALSVEISWPDKIGEPFSITDDGTGMSRTDFEYRWKTFNYDRTKQQGTDVTFPDGVRGFKRTAFGQSGKGRHAPFCFADSYTVTTWRDGKATKANISNRP